MAKEPYEYGKRALCIWQKSPMNMAKEPYEYGKRALTRMQKSPPDISVPLPRAAPSPRPPRAPCPRTVQTTGRIPLAQQEC